METKQEVTKKFLFGVILIVISLVLGKAVLIPLVLFPGSDAWRLSMILMYAFSWVLILTGIYFAGLEGWCLATHKYKEYHRRTIHKVKENSRKVATKVRDKSRHAARKTANALKKPIRRRREKQLAKKEMKKRKINI